MSYAWKKKKLGDCCEIIGGGTPAKSNQSFYNGNILWATVRDMNCVYIFDTEHKITEDAVKNSSTNIIPKENVIIATRVGLGKVCLLKNDTAINQDLKGIIPKKNSYINNKYLYYWFLSISQKIIENGTGMTVKGVKLKYIRDLEISIPPLPEQRRIVAILDKAFEAIDQALENTQGNLENIRELFQSSVENIFIREDGISEKKKLCDVCIIKPPKSEARKRLNSTDLVSFVPMKDLGICQKNFTASQVRSLEDVLGNYTYFAEEDVLIAKITPCFENGKLGIARKLTNGIGFGSSEFIVFRTTKLLFNEYLFYFISREKFRKEGVQNMSGAVGHKRVAKSFMDNYKIPLPPLPEQEQIVAKFDALGVETKKLEANYMQKMVDLEELRQSFLHKTFAGELSPRKNVDFLV